MKDLIEIKPVDREFYESRLREFLPDEIIDIHTHVYLAEHKQPAPDGDKRTVSWPALVAGENPIEDLMETYRLMLPGKSVTPLIFSSPTLGADLEVLNGYITECASRCNLPSLLLSHPAWSAEELEEKILRDSFLGVKVYLTFAPSRIPAKDVRIFDFLPPPQLEILNRHGWLVMLHIPRDKRLRDPENLSQMLEIENRYPNVKLIIAHVGRAYCPTDIGDAFKVLESTENMKFDISANTNEEVFAALIRAVGPGRILFGTDMPILRMRMRRICKDGHYVNLVSRGMYGDVSNDPNMDEVDGKEAERLSFFLYEEIEAFRQAAKTEGLTKTEIKNVFHNNADKLIKSVTP